MAEAVAVMELKKRNVHCSCGIEANVNVVVLLLEQAILYSLNIDRLGTMAVVLCRYVLKTTALPHPHSSWIVSI